MSETTPPMPMSQVEWETHWAFYRLTVAQRDAAWNEVETLRQMVDRLGQMVDRLGHLMYFVEETPT